MIEDDSDGEYPESGKPSGNPKDSYRNELLLCDKEAVRDYDKVILVLSGGALGLTLAFGDITKLDSLLGRNWLLAAWSAWAFSVACVMASLYCSHRATRTAIDRIDALPDSENITLKTITSRWDKATCWLNPSGGILFILGVCLLIVFMTKNFKDH